jgi:hypothetical protein
MCYGTSTRLHDLCNDITGPIGFPWCADASLSRGLQEVRLTEHNKLSRPKRIHSAWMADGRVPKDDSLPRGSLGHTNVSLAFEDVDTNYDGVSRVFLPPSLGFIYTQAG